MNPYYSNQIIASGFENVLLQLLNFTPRIIGFFLILFLGLFFARWIKWLTIKVVGALGLNRLVQGSPLEKFLERSDYNITFEEVLGRIVWWLVIFAFFSAAINVLGLTSISLLLTQVLSFLPKVLAAVFILVIGTLLAGVVESLIKGSVKNISISTARLVSRFASYLIMGFSVLAALSQLGIAKELINTLFIGIVAMLALGFGLAFGLGAKDLVAKILDEWYTNLKKDSR